ncbi:MAG TPA: HIT family protein [Candidatus Limnocylindrales bacterium]|nr:HIT family protein [Candidatus Limnocylindrales bacterium]
MVIIFIISCGGSPPSRERRVILSGMASDCLFCRIAAREVAASVVYEDDDFLAFLDHRPLFEGHTLLVPKVHYETLPDLPETLAGPFLTRAQLLCRAVEQALGASGTFVAINNRVSQSVPHLHLHIVPRRPKDGLKGFFWPRRKYSSDERTKAIQKDIAALTGRPAAHNQESYTV